MDEQQALELALAASLQDSPGVSSPSSSSTDGRHNPVVTTNPGCATTAAAATLTTGAAAATGLARMMSQGAPPNAFTFDNTAQNVNEHINNSSSSHNDSHGSINDASTTAAANNSSTNTFTDSDNGTNAFTDSDNGSNSGPLALPPNFDFGRDGDDWNVHPLYDNASDDDEAMRQAMAASMATYQQEQASQPVGAQPVAYTMHHCNGLNRTDPANSVRVSTFVLYPLGGTTSDPDNPLEQENRKRRIKEVITTRTNSQTGKAEYMVVCHPDGCMEDGTKRPPPGEKWRCRDCHLKRPPVYSAYNDPEAEFCKECAQHVSVCGFCHWVAEDEVSAAELRDWRRNNKPPILDVLARRFPSAEVDFQGPSPALFA